MEPGPPSVEGRGLRLARFERACLAVVAAAFLLRLHYVLDPIVFWDGAWYLQLARSFHETGAFLVPWYETPVHSGYWPPLFPVYVSAFIAALGPGYGTLVLASVTASALLTAAVFFTTRDLMGRTRAFAAAALVSVNPAFYVSDSQGMSESLLALMVVLTVWTFLKSLERPALLPLAALFGFLTYLGKANLGLPIVALAVVALVLWRVRVRGLGRTLRSPVDVGLALAAALGLAALALTRTERLGGLGVGLIEPVRAAVDEPLWLPTFAFKLLFAAGFLLAVSVPFSLRVVQAWRAPRTEATGALWLATLLPLAAGAVFTTSFYFTEKRALVDFDNVRYLTPAIVPFLWLLLPHWDAHAHAPPEGKVDNRKLRRRHEVTYACAAGLLLVVLLLNPLAGTRQTLARLVTFLLLGLAPVVIALFALRGHVEAAPRRTAKGETEHRYVPAKAPPFAGRAMLATAAVAVLLALFVSSWYVGIALAVTVALTALSPRAQAVTLALALLAVTAPAQETDVPVEDAMRRAADLLPPGATLLVTETPVYFSAVAADDLVVRNAFPGENETADGILFVHYAIPPPADGYPGYRLEETWRRGFDPTPPMAARVWIEENLLGHRYSAVGNPAFTLYVRNATG